MTEPSQEARPAALKAPARFADGRWKDRIERAKKARAAAREGGDKRLGQERRRSHG